METPSEILDKIDALLKEGHTSKALELLGEWGREMEDRGYEIGYDEGYEDAQYNIADWNEP